MENFRSYKQSLKKTIKQLQKLNSDNLDNDYKILKKAFDITYNNKIFSLYNLEAPSLDIYRLKMFKELTKISGSLSFLGIQILAANSIMKKRDYTKKEKFFNKKCGIAINHLRAPITLVSGKKVKDGFLLNGTLTWASGYKIFDNLLIGFHCNGYEYESIAEFKSNKGFIIGEADKTFVGYSLNTVNIKLQNFFIPSKHIVSKMPLGTYTKAKSLSKTVHFCLYSLGNAACLQIKDKNFKSYSKKKLNRIKKAFLKSNDPKEMDILRIKLFSLVQDIITAGMILNGGSSILSSKELQRLYRELIMFNSNGLNSTLKQLFKEKYSL